MQQLDLPKNYPSGLHDHEIQKYVTIALDATNSYARNQNVVKGASYWKDIADIGIAELNKRIQNRNLANIEHLNTQITTLNNQIRFLNIENRKSGRVNKTMTIITIVLACISIGLSYITVFPIKDKEQEIIEARKMDLLRLNYEALKEQNYLTRQQQLKDDAKRIESELKNKPDKR